MDTPGYIVRRSFRKELLIIWEGGRAIIHYGIWDYSACWFPVSMTILPQDALRPGRPRWKWPLLDHVKGYNISKSAMALELDCSGWRFENRIFALLDICGKPILWTLPSPPSAWRGIMATSNCLHYHVPWCTWDGTVPRIFLWSVLTLICHSACWVPIWLTKLPQESPTTCATETNVLFARSRQGVQYIRNLRWCKS